MLLSLRQIKARIRGVSNTKKITQAMEMVSGSKLKRAEGALFELKPYFMSLESLLKNLIGSIDRNKYLFLQEGQNKDKAALCVITSDAGLCSTYNDNIIRLAENFINKRGKDKVKLIIVGKRGFSYFRKHHPEIILQSFTGLNGRLSDEAVDRLAQIIIQSFVNQEVDEAYGIYTQFINAVKYRPTLEKLLNIELDLDVSLRGIKPRGNSDCLAKSARNGAEGEVCNDNMQEYIFEPGADEILEELFPIYFFSKIRFLLLNSFTAEHSARMIAMKAATDNAAELIDSLTLLRNKARQTLITKEVIEVSSAAEILKG